MGYMGHPEYCIGSLPKSNFLQGFYILQLLRAPIRALLETLLFVPDFIWTLLALLNRRVDSSLRNYFLTPLGQTLTKINVENGRKTGFIYSLICGNKHPRDNVSAALALNRWMMEAFILQPDLLPQVDTQQADLDAAAATARTASVVLDQQQQHDYSVPPALQRYMMMGGMSAGSHDLGNVGLPTIDMPAPPTKPIDAATRFGYNPSVVCWKQLEYLNPDFTLEHPACASDLHLLAPIFQLAALCALFTLVRRGGVAPRQAGIHPHLHQD